MISVERFGRERSVEREALYRFEVLKHDEFRLDLIIL
jgi:hypothetical protein